MLSPCPAWWAAGDRPGSGGRATRPGAQGLQTNGLDALRAIGAEQAVAGVGFPTPGIEFPSWTGKVLGAVPTTGPDGGVGLSLRRSHLYRALHTEAVRRGVRGPYGSRLV